MSLVALVALAILTAGRAEAAEAHAGQPVMGTVLEVTVVAPDAVTARRLADAAIAEARRWDDVLTTWRPEGELAILNAHAGEGSIPVSAELARSLVAMRSFWQATGGAFDPAVGPLVELLRRAPTETKELAAVGPVRLDEALRLEDGRAAVARGARLDAGAIGKGIALDAIARLLRKGGAGAAFLDFGGSSQLAFGSPDEPSGWSVAVAGLTAGELLGAVRLRDASLSTSRATGAGDEAGPILDPRTRRPIDRPRLAIVLAADAATADAWSTALVVLGDAGLERAAANGVEALVADGSGVRGTARFPLAR